MARNLAPPIADENRGWLLLGGTLMFIFGVLAAMAPPITAIAVELAAGWLLLLGGLFGLGLTVVGPPVGGSAWWWNLSTSTFAAVIGSLLLWHPTFGVLSMTLILAGYLAASGIAKLAIALLYRASIGSLASWIVAAGVLDLAISWMVLSQWPLSASWFIGLLVGINLISGGVLLLGAALHSTRPASNHSKAAAH
jgi:uncharacterized membrane protein HdeD (DUF308 family)